MALPITYEHITKEYDLQSGEVLTAVSDASVTVEGRSFTSLVGPSGCGKSTLLHIAAGLIDYNSGVARIGDLPVAAGTQNVGIMFQSPVLLPWRTVLDNVLLPCELTGLDKAEYRERALELLRTVGIEQFAGNHPRELSGGMQQRAALARVLITRPEVMLLDEPFSALDEFTREALNLELLDLWTKLGPTVCFVTHNIAEAALLSDKIVVMSPRPGRIIGEVPVPLSRPRTASMITEPDLQEIVATVREMLRGSLALPVAGELQDA
jgi:NitT/TauT family transport system ATP-binding protein